MMLVRYKYKVKDLGIVGCYECDVKDFRKMWSRIRNDVDWCCVDIKEGNLEWSVCDCWLFDKVWCDNGWYKNGWRFLKGK